MHSEPLWGYYPKLCADTILKIQEATPIAYLPWAALDWHGPHLPLGMNGLIVEEMVKRIAARTGGVILPTTWWSLTRRNATTTLSIPRATLSDLWDATFEQVAQAGWRIIVVVNGNTTAAHELTLIDAAETAMQRHQTLVFAVPPLELVDETMLDCGGLWETSMAYALCPQLVQMHAFGNTPFEDYRPHLTGRDPRGTASSSLGETAIQMATEYVVRAVRQLLSERSAYPIHVLYEQRRQRYQRAPRP